MNPPKISEAEWRVARVVWERNPISTTEVIEALAEETGWKPETIRTLLTRLVQKAVLKHEKCGRTFYYAPVVSEGQGHRSARQSFLKKIYGGALKPMLSHFIEENDLSDEEIKELRQLLDAKRKEKRS